MLRQGGSVIEAQGSLLQNKLAIGALQKSADFQSVPFPLWKTQCRLPLWKTGDLHVGIRMHVRPFTHTRAYNFTALNKAPAATSLAATQAHARIHHARGSWRTMINTCALSCLALSRSSASSLALTAGSFTTRRSCIARAA